MLFHIILVIKRVTISRSSRSSIRKNIPYKILAIGNYSVEIFGYSIKVLIPWEIMTSRKMIFWFQETIGVLIERSTLNFLVNLNSKGSYFLGKLDSRVLISRVLFYRDTGNQRLPFLNCFEEILFLVKNSKTELGIGDPKVWALPIYKRFVGCFLSRKVKSSVVILVYLTLNT